MKTKSLIIVSTIVVVAAVFGGIGFDRWRAAKRLSVASTQTVAAKRPPLPQWGALLPEGDNIEVSGSAMCGYCTWRVGEPPDNLVLQMSTEPGIVFVVGNEKRTEIEKLTGACSGGDYYITARGTVTQYNGHNYMLVKNFEAMKTK
ncbi:MAG: hypothetical protein ACR2MF_00765 [Chthoniobacterales bacterium]